MTSEFCHKQRFLHFFALLSCACRCGFDVLCLIQSNKKINTQVHLPSSGSSHAEVSVYTTNVCSRNCFQMVLFIAKETCLQEMRVIVVLDRFFQRHDTKHKQYIYRFSIELSRGQSQHTESSLDCRSTGRAIDPALGACFIQKIIFISLVVPSPVQPYSAEV